MLFVNGEMFMTIARRQEDEEAGSKALLRNFCDGGFGGSVSEAAVVLGRTPEELEAMLNGDEPVDDDLEMKIRGVAQERGIGLE